MFALPKGCKGLRHQLILMVSFALLQSLQGADWVSQNRDFSRGFGVSGITSLSAPPVGFSIPAGNQSGNDNGTMLGVEPRKSTINYHLVY